MGNGVRLAIALAAVTALLACAATAAAAAPPDLGELLECATYPSGDAICSGSVPSFDGAPLDVDLTLPREGVAKKGLIVLLHGFGNDKHYWESNTDEGDGEDLHRWNTHWFARNGYYALTYTARGFKTSAAPADRPQTPFSPNGSASAPDGNVKLKSRDWEIRDTQWLAALVAKAYGDLDPKRIAVTGNSYGGGESWLQASQARWDFPARATGGALPVLELQVAVPKYGWTDLGHSLAPNGRASTGRSESDTGEGFPLGTPKQSYLEGFYALGQTQPFGFDPAVNAWHARIQVDPYDVAGVEDPVIRDLRAGLTEARSAYYQDEGFAAQRRARKVAIFAPQGWTDDLFPAQEAFRQFKYLKALDPDWPVEVAVADVGHPRAQNPSAQWQALNARANLFLREHIGGSHEQRTGVWSLPTVCRGTAPAPVAARAPEQLASGRLTVAFRTGGTQSLGSGAGDPDGAATDPVFGGTLFPEQGECRRSEAAAHPGRYTVQSAPLRSAATYVGLGEVTVPYTLAGTSATLNARVWDVAPDGEALLVTRGSYRLSAPARDQSTGVLHLPLFGNHWRLAAGHRLRLDLASVDQPTFKPNTANGTVTFAAPTLVLPTREGDQRLGEG